MKKIIIIVGAILIAVLIAAGSFYGGMAYQRNQANTTRERFFRERGLEGDIPSQGMPGPGGPNGRFFFGGGATGEVKSLDGNTLTLSTPQNEEKVTLSDTTSIAKTVEGTLADLQPGQQVMIIGQRDDNGNITATQILILNTDMLIERTAP